MITLGLDPSLRAFGWAVHDSTAQGLARRISSGHEGTTNTIVSVARFVHFRELVNKLISKYKIDLVGIESPAYGAGPFQTIHFGLMMFALEVIFNNRKDCVLFDPSTLKSLVRGDPKKKGIVGKLEMQRFVQLDTLDTKIVNNNEADAYCVALFANKFISVKNGILPLEKLTTLEYSTFIGKTKKIKTLSGVKIKRISHIFRENSRYFQFSNIPSGDVYLPNKSEINPKILKHLEDTED